MFLALIMKQQTKFRNVSHKNMYKKQEKKLADHFSKLNTNEMSIMCEIFDEYDGLKKFGEKQSLFFSNLEYMLPLLGGTKRIKKGSQKKN